MQLSSNSKLDLYALYAFVLYPGFLYIFQRVFADVVLIENDLVLCAAAAGVMIGFAVGIVARTDSSTGGTDIPPLFT